MSHINIGICFDELEEYTKASRHLELSLEYLEKCNNSFVSKALFILTHVKAKQKDFNLAFEYFKKGKMYSYKNNDNEYAAKFKILEGLYFSYGEYHHIEDAFTYLKSKKLYADVENYAIEVGDYFHQTGDLVLSNQYYRLSIEARKKIKKGEVINENHSGSVGSAGIE